MAKVNAKNERVKRLFFSNLFIHFRFLFLFYRVRQGKEGRRDGASSLRLLAGDFVLLELVGGNGGGEP